MEMVLKANFQGVVAAYVIQVGVVDPRVDTSNHHAGVSAGTIVHFYIRVDHPMVRLYSIYTSDLA